MLNLNYVSVPSKEKLQVWYDDKNVSWKECGNSLSCMQDYNQWMTLSFLDGWVTCIGWIITDHWNSCYTVCSVYEFVNDGWVTYIGWIITDHQSSCYTISSVYEWAIKEGLCYWGSKTLLREIWSGEGWWRQHFGRRVPTMDPRGENLSKLNSRSRIDWLHMKRAR